MANKTFKDIFGDVLKKDLPGTGSGFSDKKLGVSDLEGVIGGVMDRTQERLLKLAVSTAKNTYNCTLEEVLNGIPEYYDQYSSKYPNVTMEDVSTWISNNWDQI